MPAPWPRPFRARSIPAVNTTSWSFAGATPTRCSGTASSIADDFDTFLTLLTTQLQNQDPLDPLDTNQFTQMEANFSLFFGLAVQAYELLLEEEKKHLKQFETEFEDMQDQWN